MNARQPTVFPSVKGESERRQVDSVPKPALDRNRSMPQFDKPPPRVSNLPNKSDRTLLTDSTTTRVEPTGQATKNFPQRNPE